MSEVAWFTLLLRAAGLLIIAQMTPGAIGYLGYVPQALSGGWDLWYSLGEMGWLVGYLSAVGFGLYLLLGGRRIVRFCTRDLLERCAVCGYPLAKIQGDVCPECGVPLRKIGSAPEKSVEEAS